MLGTSTCADCSQHTLSGDAGWETAEAVLFAARSVHVAVKATMRESASGNSELQHHQQEIKDFMRHLFTMIAEAGHVVTSHPTVIESAARCLHTYSRWAVQQVSFPSTCPNNIVIPLAGGLAWTFY